MAKLLTNHTPWRNCTRTAVATHPRAPRSSRLYHHRYCPNVKITCTVQCQLLQCRSARGFMLHSYAPSLSMGIGSHWKAWANLYCTVRSVANPSIPTGFQLTAVLSTASGKTPILYPLLHIDPSSMLPATCHLPPTTCIRRQFGTCGIDDNRNIAESWTWGIGESQRIPPHPSSF